MISDSVPNLLQLMALPMEAVGLLLATIEMRFPELEKAIIERSNGTRRFATQEEQAGYEVAHDRWLKSSFRELVMGAYIEKRARISTPIFGVALVWLVLGFGLGILNRQDSSLLILDNAFPLAVLFLIAPILMHVIGAAIMYASARIVRFTRNFSKERRLGSLGLLIAGVGLLLEAYQVIAIMLSEESTIASAPLTLKLLVATGCFMLFVFLWYILAVARGLKRAT